MNDTAYTWDMSGYSAKYSFLLNAGGLTMREVERVFQLDPAPPEVEDCNDYITAAVRESDYKYFSFFLHHYERSMNSLIYSFLTREGLGRYAPDRFLDYKMGCVLAMLECLPSYTPDKGADFLTYAHYKIGNALLHSRMMEEAGSFKNLDEYKMVRGIAWLYNETDKNEQKAVRKYARKKHCSTKTAMEYLKLAVENRSRVPFYGTMQDEDSEETGEDVTRDDSWNYTDILWNGLRTDTIQAAFEKLSYREQTLLEKRNAICMTCGWVSSLKVRSSFDDLAVMFEGSGASGAERAYGRAVDKLTMLLVEAGTLHTVRLKRISQKRTKQEIAAAVYQYQADNDGEWGEILFDFISDTTEILKLAELDTTKTNRFAKRAISHILSLTVDELPKNLLLAFE